jgi:hypothetical protein
MGFTRHRHQHYVLRTHAFTEAEAKVKTTFSLHMQSVEINWRTYSTDYNYYCDKLMVGGGLLTLG